MQLIGLNGKGLDMKYLQISMLVLTVCISCGKDAPSGDVLTQAEMVKALKALYIAEEHVSRFGLKPDSSRKFFQRLEGKIFDQLEIDEPTFRRSFDYYVQHPDEWEQVYATLVDSLNLEEQRYSLPAE